MEVMPKFEKKGSPSITLEFPERKWFRNEKDLWCSREPTPQEYRDRARMKEIYREAKLRGENGFSAITKEMGVLWKPSAA